MAVLVVFVVLAAFIVFAALVGVFALVVVLRLAVLMVLVVFAAFVVFFATVVVLAFVGSTVFGEGWLSAHQGTTNEGYKRTAKAESSKATSFSIHTKRDFEVRFY
jgi:asparagine N-glycosylation enzyme membrane subunit Stt3